MYFVLVVVCLVAVKLIAWKDSSARETFIACEGMLHYDHLFTLSPVTSYLCCYGNR